MTRPPASWESRTSVSAPAMSGQVARLHLAHRGGLAELGALALEPRCRRRAQRLAAGDAAGDRLAEDLGLRGGRDEAVDPVLDELDRRVVGTGDDDRRRARGRGLDHGEPVALAA